MMFVVIILLVMNISQSVSSQPSADEWYRLDDALYLVDNTTRLNYDDAQSLCQEYGSNLARVDSDEIQSFLTTFITPPFSTIRCFWIGCHDREVEGQFKWLDGTLVGYDGWATNQPDDARENQDCACLWSSENPNRHGRWDDNSCVAPINLICQKGVYNFQPKSARSSPGTAFVSCAVDVELENRMLSPNDVRLSVGQSLSSTRSIPYSSTSLDGGVRNNSFLIENIDDDDRIYCHVGELPRTARSFSRVRFGPINFYALPALTSGPTVRDISSSSFIVSWSSWIPCLDSGEGPVVGYLIYQQTLGSEWEEVVRIDSAEVHGDLQRRMDFVLSGLEPGTEYNISVSAVREGAGGEGPRSPHVTVTTTNLESKRRFGILGESGLIWVLFGVSLAGNVFLVVLVVIICRKQRKPRKKSLSCSRGVRAADDPKVDQYDVPRALGGRDQYDVPQTLGDQEDHIYEGLQRTESRNKESCYLSMDNPDRVDYVNMNM